MSHRATFSQDQVQRTENAPIVVANALGDFESRPSPAASTREATALRRTSSLQTVIVAVTVLSVVSVGALFAWMAEAPVPKRADVHQTVAAPADPFVLAPLSDPAGLDAAHETNRPARDARWADRETLPDTWGATAGLSSSAAGTDGQSRQDTPRGNKFAPLAQPRSEPLSTGLDATTSTESTGGTNAGGVIADFDPLIELIENTIEVDTWDPVGDGTMQEFESGVRIDPSGLMQLRTAEDAGEKLDAARLSLAKREPTSDAQSSLGSSALRKISLLHLMGQVRRLLDAGKELPEAIRYLGGLTAIRYVFVYPEAHDIVLAGPAEDWRRDELGRPVGARTGRALLELDDLMTLVQAFRNGGSVGCSIDPRESGLKEFREHLVASRGPVSVGRRDEWVGELRDRLGVQDIVVWGVPAGSRVGRVLVEADYRMKLIGFDLAQSIPGIPSYFDLLEQDSAGRRRNFESLRWWFTMHYESVTSNADQTAFEIVGSPARLQSENEFLTQVGGRVHTGRSDPTNTRFAQNFTDHFSELADADPVFSSMAGVFNLAVVAALIEQHDLPQRAGWPATWLAHRYPVPQGRAPETVESVMNYREFSPREFTAAVSGGVRIDPGPLVENLAEAGEGTSVTKQYTAAHREPNTSQPWWWD